MISTTRIDWCKSSQARRESQTIFSYKPVPTRKTTDFIYLDVEVAQTAAQAGGFSSASMRRRGLAVAATWRKQNGGYRIYFEADCQRLIDDLGGAGCVVGFNCRRFDYEVLKGHLSFRRPKTCDLLEVVADCAGLRVSLMNLALWTLGRGRSSDGDRNTALWASGKREPVVHACKRDVFLIRRLHEHVIEHGFVSYLDGDGGCQRVAVAIPLITTRKQHGSGFTRRN